MAETQAVTPLRLLRRRFVSPLLIILTVGAVISAATRPWADAVAIAVMVALTAAMSFWQDWRAERARRTSCAARPPSPAPRDHDLFGEGENERIALRCLAI